MNTSYVNESIRCTVENCKYHSDGKDYCSLGSICVGAHKNNPTDCKCVDCKSFERADKYYLHIQTII